MYNRERLTFRTDKLTIRYSLSFTRTIVVSGFIVATGCDSNDGQKKEPIPKPTIQSSTVNTAPVQISVPSKSQAVENEPASPIVVPPTLEAPVTPQVPLVSITPSTERTSLTLDNSGWPNVPEKSLLPEKPETFRLTLEEYRLILEQKRKILEQRRDNRDVDLEEYLSEFEKYRDGINRYRDGMAAYLKSFDQ